MDCFYHSLKLLKVESISSLSIEVLDDIAQKKADETVLFHCAGCKGRTRIATMLLLDIVGLSLQDIITNYKVSFTNLTFSSNKKSI